MAGGEGYDWYYDSVEAEQAQRRTAIADDAYGEDWVFRFKDLKGWWSHDHHERIGGVRQLIASDWVPGLKPVRFTEYGCSALDKGTNQPNKFLDPKSSESALPRYSNGLRDDFLQLRYFLAMSNYWASESNNPYAVLYPGRMVDFPRSHAWAWDARPFPEFPGNMSVWSDGENYAKGHWLNGRTSNQPLSQIILEICDDSKAGAHLNVNDVWDVSHGFASTESATARAKLQTLSMAYGFDASEAEGTLRFKKRNVTQVRELDVELFAVSTDGKGPIEESRAPNTSLVERVRLT